MPFSIVMNPEISANDLNDDLDVVHQWVHQWNLIFNPDPTKQGTEVLFSCKNPNHPQKRLGLTLDSSLSFKNILIKKSFSLRRIPKH